MQSQKCEPRQLYKETSSLERPNNFFLINTLFWRRTSFDA